MLNKLEDAKPLKEILEDLLRKSPGLSALLIPGYKIKTPFDLRNVGTEEEFHGKEYPNYFKLMQDEIKQCPLNQKFRVKYETDACNDYFTREKLPGRFELYVGDNPTSDYILNLWNGLATLTVSLPENVNPGTILDYTSTVTDETQVYPFKDKLKVEVLKPVKKHKGNSGDRKKPPSVKKGKERAISSRLSLPQVVEIHKEDWEVHGFDEFSALEAEDTGEEGYDFYVNMDNIFLHSEIKAKSSVDAKLLQERYKYALVLVGLALLKEDEEKKQENEEEKDVFKEVFEITERLSPIILPMIDYLGELEIED
jgi:hypothetical protein